MGCWWARSAVVGVAGDGGVVRGGAVCQVAAWVLGESMGGGVLAGATDGSVAWAAGAAALPVRCVCQMLRGAGTVPVARGAGVSLLGRAWA